jgi:hypothetical protein
MENKEAMIVAARKTTDSDRMNYSIQELFINQFLGQLNLKLTHS